MMLESNWANKLLMVVSLATSACGGSDSTPSAPPPLGTPITGLTAGSWNWVDFPDAVCGDGSPTGIGVNPGTNDDLVIFLNGGGACSSGVTCFTWKTATTLGPFGSTEFNAQLPQVQGTILDRAVTGNPFATSTLVYFPYCTGDVHGGDKVATYTDVPGTVHHMGHTNVLAFMKRLAATYTTPPHLAVTGSSAGGFGTLVNYQAIRAYYPAADSILIDDSGPALESNGGPLIEAGFVSWGIADVVDPLCGGAGICEPDLAKGFAALIKDYPSDRFSLLSWNEDDVIDQFYQISPADFTTQLLQMNTDVIVPAANARAFIAAGVYHTMLGIPAQVSQNGITLIDWLAAQVSGSAAWVAVQP